MFLRAFVYLKRLSRIFCRSSYSEMDYQCNLTFYELQDLYVVGAGSSCNLYMYYNLLYHQQVTVLCMVS